MRKIVKSLPVSILLLGSLLPVTLAAAPRPADGNSKALAKLQAMVQEATSERDQLKTEKDKLTTEIDGLKKDIESKASNEERISAELAAQKSSNAVVSNTLQQTHAKLLEVQILSAYEHHGVFNSLLESEPVFQFKTVEMEGIVQEYQDKLRKQTYHNGNNNNDKTP